MNNYQELLSELLELEELGKNGLLKGIDGNAFDKKMRVLNISSDESIGKITKAKFEQKQKKIETISTPRSGYIGGDFLLEWKAFLEEFSGNSYINNQTYFPLESEKKVLEELGKLFKSAKSRIWIYDNYFDKKILSLITGNIQFLEVKVISTKGLVDIEKLITAFRLLNENKTIELRKYNFAHDRFYIIDDIIYSLGTSLQKPNRATLFTKLEKEEGEKFLSDFNEGWNSSIPILINESQP